MNTFQSLWTCWPWRPIRNCPGRFILPRTEHPVSFETLLGISCIPRMFSSLEAKDTVLVIPLTDGGLIAYQQTDGRLIHTLNTPDGFSRKLHQLGITLDMSNEK